MLGQTNWGGETFSSLTICLSRQGWSAQSLWVFFLSFLQMSKVLLTTSVTFLKSFGVCRSHGNKARCYWWCRWVLYFFRRKMWHALKWQQLRKSRSYWGCKEFTSLRAVQMSLLFSQVVINAFQSLQTMVHG